MSRAGDDEIELLPFPEEAVRQLLVVKQELVVVKLILRLFGYIILIRNVLFVSHCRREHPSGVERRVIIMVNFRRIALIPQYIGQRLVKVIGYIVKSISAGTAEEGPGIDAEFSIERPDAAIARSIEFGKIHSFCHQPRNGGGMLSDHPVVHGFHQYQNHIFPLEQSGHGIVLAFFLGIKKGIQSFLCLLLGLGIGRCDGIQIIGIDIFHRCLVDTADLIQPMGVKHVFISRFR